MNVTVLTAISALCAALIGGVVLVRLIKRGWDHQEAVDLVVIVGSGLIAGVLCLVSASPLRSFFGLLHGDLIDVR